MASNRRQQFGGKSSSTSTNAAPQLSKSQATHGRRILQASGSLEIIDGKGGTTSGTSSPGNSRPPSEASLRSWSRSSVGSIPPRSDSSLSRRTLTPTKQVSLQAVRRKEESDEPFVDDVDWRTLNDGVRNAWDREGSVDDLADHAAKLRLPRMSQSTSETDFSGQEKLTNGHSSSVKEGLIEEEKEIDEKEVDTEDDDDDDESEEEEERKAPNELLMEFVDCVIKKDFKNADKLCTMILLYEPANPEALKFKPLIEEKMRLDEEAANEEGSDDDDDDEDDDDDDDDDDSDDDSSEEDSSEEEDDDDEGAAGGSGSQAPGSSAASNRTRDIFDLTAPSDSRWEYTLRDSKPSGSKS